jgi:hypothetical protein
VESKELFAKAKEEGIAVKTLRRAKDLLGVEAEKVHSTWFWKLPLEDGQDAPPRVTTFNSDEAC